MLATPRCIILLPNWNSDKVFREADSKAELTSLWFCVTEDLIFRLTCTSLPCLGSSERANMGKSSEFALR